MSAEQENNKPDLEIITREEFQQQQAEQIEKEIFGSEANAEKTAGLIQSFVASYEQQKGEVALEPWLISEFKKYPDVWTSSEELMDTAGEIIRSIERSAQAKASLQAHLDKGKSRDSWLAGEIERGAGVAGNLNVGAYAHSIDTTLQQSNEAMLGTILTKSGKISNAYNLDGFIAESHHANSFNIDAASKGSGYRAEVVGSYGKDSVDIVIKDAQGHVVKSYQSKYGQDANATEQMLNRGDYSSQEALVPKGQSQDIRQPTTERIEIEGVSSKPLSKEEAKTLQKQAQLEKEAQQYDWNDTSRMDISKQIGKQALLAASVTAGFQGVRILGRRVWNKLNGKENPPASEDLKEFFESSLKSGAQVGAQVAVSGAVVVAVKNGWLGAALMNTPAGKIANAVFVGMENAKVLYKLAKGELSSTEAMNEMGNVTCAAVGGIAGGIKGAALGSLLGPVGSFAGAIVGSMAGSKIGEAVFAGGKAVVKTAAKVIKTVWEGAKEAATAVLEKLNPLRWFA